MKKAYIIHHKYFEIFIHIISWMLIFVFPLFLTDPNGNINWEQYYKHIITTSSYCVLFYANYFYLIPRVWFNNHILKFVVVNMVLLLLFIHGVHYIQEGLFLRPLHVGPPHMHRPPMVFFYFFRSLPMIFVIALSMIIRINQQWHRMRDKLVEAEQEKTEAELSNLKNQLNPHFLLNTLNNIYALISFNADKAQEAVHELSKLLRYMLYDNQVAFVPLEKELDFINNYVSLMRIRIARSVDVSVQLEAGPKIIFISPLIFISLIENAFKHGISPTEKSFISISIKGHSDGRVCCEIMNSNYPKAITDKSGSGIGLEQVGRRLELIYPNQYEWNKGIGADGTTYTSILTIQTEEA